MDSLIHIYLPGQLPAFFHFSLPTSSVSAPLLRDLKRDLQNAKLHAALTDEQRQLLQTAKDQYEKGRELYAQYRDFLAELTRTYGVPGQYLVSFWLSFG